MIRLAVVALLVACAPKPTGSEPPPPVVNDSAAEQPPPTDEEPPPEESDSECTKEECGPAPGMPNQNCPDGKTVAGPACMRDDAGKCGWVIVECPP